VGNDVDLRRPRLVEHALQVGGELLGPGLDAGRERDPRMVDAVPAAAEHRAHASEVMQLVEGGIVGVVDPGGRVPEDVEATEAVGEDDREGHVVSFGGPAYHAQRVHRGCDPFDSV
jgi:hypothetical protein